jgi:hypothetical protein
MKLIGLLTEDPRAYYEILAVLREQNLRFVTLDFSDPAPANVGVIITTEHERHLVPFDRIVVDPDPVTAVARARLMLSAESEVRDIVIGIDPGVRPGFAVLGDGAVLMRALASTPESVGGLVEDVLREYPSANVVVRIGNGDRTNRNRIFNKLWDEGHMLEIVDERNTTTRSPTPDEDAAVEIAMTPGYRPAKRQETNPCPGEIRNIQRISRLESGGSLTVSRELARKVALGELTLSDAIEQMKSPGGGY